MTTTPYTHFTVIADGMAGNLTDGFECPTGPAIMSMNTWALDTEQALDIIRTIGEQIGFQVSGEVQIYQTDPSQPPTETLSGYGINFTPYEED